MAAAEKINSSYVSRLLRLTLLAPGIVEAILDGLQPEGMTLPGLMEGVEAQWERQRDTVGIGPVQDPSCTTTVWSGRNSAINVGTAAPDNTDTAAASMPDRTPGAAPLPAPAPLP